MLLSGCSAVCSQPDTGPRNICFCHSWQQPAADKRLHFQLVFFCAFTAQTLCSCLCTGLSIMWDRGWFLQPGTSLNLMVHDLTSHTSETEQTRVRPFGCRKQNFIENLCLHKLPVRHAELCRRCKLFVFRGFWPGGGREAMSVLSFQYPDWFLPGLRKAPEEERVLVFWEQPKHKLHTSCGTRAPLLKCCSSPESSTAGLLVTTWLCSWTVII